MALIRTIGEAKQFLPRLLGSLNATSLLPDIGTAERKYVVPVIGVGLYQGLQAKYDTNALSADERQLVNHLNLVALSYAYLDDMAAGHVVITDFGVRTNDGADTGKAFAWEYKELRKYLQNKALDGLEQLLTYLWANKGTFALWTSSPEFRAFEGLLIKTGTEFNSFYQLFQPMRTFYAIRPALDDMQEEYLQASLGSALLQFLVKAADPTNELKVAIRQMKKALAYFTVHKAADHYAVRLSDAGLTLASDFTADPDGPDAGRAAASLQWKQEFQQVLLRDAHKFFSEGKKSLVAYRKREDVPELFKSAFDAGPLVKLLEQVPKESNNAGKKTFRT